MRLSTLFEMGRTGRLPLVGAVLKDLAAMHRLAFLSAAGTEGVLSALREGPRTLEDLGRRLEVPPEQLEILEAWLEVGVRARVLNLTPDGYALWSSLGRALADPQNDDLMALIQEGTSLHHALLTSMIPRLREGRPFTLDDQDGEMIARSSRFLEPLVREAIDGAFPEEGPMRFLEVGCGSGTYLRYCLERNPEATAVGLEMQPEVAAMARDLLARHGLADRAEIRSVDVRDLETDPSFQRVTLHNNVYYFPVDRRCDVLAHLRGFLEPGGRLLITTGCLGGSAGMAVLSLWGAATAGCGRLPGMEELVEQLLQAGFVDVDARNMVPGDRYVSFVASTRKD